MVDARLRPVERRQLPLQPVHPHAQQCHGFIEQRHMGLRAFLLPGVGRPVLRVGRIQREPFLQPPLVEQPRFVKQEFLHRMPAFESGMLS